MGSKVDRGLYAVSQEILRHMFRPAGHVGVLSATLRGLGAGENTRRKTQLIQDIQSLGYTYTTAKGIFSGDIEDAILVWGIRQEDLFNLMAKYGQQSVILKSPGSRRPVYYDQDARAKYLGQNLVFGSESDTELLDRTEIRRDPAQRFRIEFDWDRPYPWSLRPDKVEAWVESRPGTRQVAKLRRVALSWCSWG